METGKDDGKIGDYKSDEDLVNVDDVPTGNCWETSLTPEERSVNKKTTYSYQKWQITGRTNMEGVKIKEEVIGDDAFEEQESNEDKAGVRRSLRNAKKPCVSEHFEDTPELPEEFPESNESPWQRQGKLLNLKSHMRVHSEDKMHRCKECSFACISASQLKTHMWDHMGIKPFACSECNFSCLQPKAMQQHYSLHSGNRPFACSLCSFTFKKLSTLKKHTETHLLDKPMVCNECDYRCIRKSDLKSHMRLHTGEKPYTCDYCGYKCAHNSRMKVHIRTHTGEKPYNCPQCSYSCVQSSRLAAHMKTHSDEQLQETLNQVDEYSASPTDPESKPSALQTLLDYQAPVPFSKFEPPDDVSIPVLGALDLTITKIS
ncbi:hypothetical protein GE061_004399 [Apolygus lucorum]|uniref:C2H2-type domain-containing protein n=1 Tax=Apolygus lucorum TaxID=248454 RepID=A0A8S9WZ97_APOLU|nr:hypothetical protein GE061_004399 [Apolygus lucorum]